MCLLALFFRVVEDATVVAGANREEYYQRGGEPPRLLDGPIPAVAGIDPVAGGTWFGVNASRVLVAVTNRRKLDVPAQPRSRGLLVREMLGCPSAAAALDLGIAALEQNRYAGANFLCADASRAVVIQAGDWLRVKPLPPGIHVLANRDVNDASDARVTYARSWLNGRPYATAADCMRALAQLCAQQEPDDPPMCFRDYDRGTVSSSIVALRGTLTDSSYLHAQGAPCQTPYADYGYLLHDLRTKAEREVTRCE
ncbi:MAG TPA: NRDE family protein [Gemmataceae bacterium]|nr:NRDE family protein [Gemmataceae bacterium]